MIALNKRALTRSYSLNYVQEGLTYILKILKRCIHVRPILKSSYFYSTQTTREDLYILTKLLNHISILWDKNVDIIVVPITRFWINLH